MGRVTLWPHKLYYMQQNHRLPHTIQVLVYISNLLPCNALLSHYLTGTDRSTSLTPIQSFDHQSKFEQKIM